MHSKSFRCHTMYPTCCYSIPLQAQKGSPNSSIWERRKLGLTKEGLNDFPEGSQSLALASSHYPLPPPQKLCSPGRAPAGWESLVLDGWSPVGSVVRFCSLREGEECSHPALGGYPGHSGAASELLEKSCHARNSALQVVTSPSVQSEPQMGPGSVRRREEVLLLVWDLVRRRQ